MNIKILKSRVLQIGLVLIFLGLLTITILPQTIPITGPNMVSKLLMNNQPFDLPFPRLGMWWPNTWTQTKEDISRYDYVVFKPWDLFRLEGIKAVKPDLIALNATNACELYFEPDAGTSFGENAVIQTIPYQWFLTQVGSTLVNDVDATQTNLPVASLTASKGGKTYNLFVPGDTVLIEGESVYVNAVDTATKTLTVRRGYVRPASSHSSGTRIAAHISYWPSTWMLNVSTMSPSGIIDPALGNEQWTDFNARRAASMVEDPSWDGILLDRVDPNESWLIGSSTARTIDPDQSNTLLSDYSAFDAAWNQGLEHYITSLRSLVGDNRVIITNWGMSTFSPYINGNNLESFPLSSGGSHAGSWTKTVVGPLPNSGSYFDWMKSTRQPNLSMIQTYEDDGVPDPSDSSDYVNPIDQPNYKKMRFGLTTALLDDGFFSYEVNTNGHGSIGLYWFDEYDNAGQNRGYLGLPLTPAHLAIENVNNPNLINGGELDTQTDINLWSIRADAPDYSASVSLDTNDKTSGSGSARINVAKSAGTDWHIVLMSNPLTVLPTTEYTLSFWAKATSNRKIDAWVQHNSSPWENRFHFGDFDLTTDWQYFETSISSTSGGNGSDLFYFGLGQSIGNVWIDKIVLQKSLPNIWRRDFANGIVLVNPTSSEQHVQLNGTFQKIKGTQAPDINDGSTVTDVTLPVQDGLVLLGTTSAAPTPVLTSLDPTTMDVLDTSAQDTGSGITITLNGSGFVPLSVVLWNDIKLTTTFINNTQLTAIVPLSNLAVPGIVNITIFTPEPGGGTSTPQTITLSRPYTPPVAVDDNYQALTDTTLNVNDPGILTNDQHADNTTLIAVNNSDPSHGTLTLNNNGSFTFVPESGYIGLDSFTYSVNDGTNTSAPVTVTINIQPQNMPIRLSPANGTQLKPGIMTATLKWVLPTGKTAREISAYQVAISTDPLFTNLFTPVKSTSKTTLTTPPLLPNNTYYWRVRAIFRNGVIGSWSNLAGQNSIIVPKLLAPKLVSPTNGKLLTTASIKFSWAKPTGTPGGALYIIDFGNDQAFTPGTYTEQISSKLLWTGPVPYTGKIYWQVKVVSADKKVEYSGFQTTTRALLKK